MILIKTNKEKLLKPLQTVTGIVEKRQTQPILSNVLITCTNGEINFQTTDLEIQIKTFSKEEIFAEESFSLTVPAKKLQDILRSLPSDTEIIISKKDEYLSIKSGKSKFNLQILPAEDFPKITIENNLIASINLQQIKLKELFQKVQFSIAQQDIRYYLNGLLLQVEDHSLRGVATDGHRLAYSSIDIEKKFEKQEIILPRKTVFELTKLLDEVDDEVTIEIFQKKVRFCFSNIVLVSKVIEGKYPDYNRVIPQNNNEKFILNHANFFNALQRVAILSNQTDQLKGVRLVISNNNLSIYCKNSEQEEATESLEIQYAQENIDISLNITYLLDLLNNVPSDTIQCALENANSGVLITIPEDKNYKYIVMPMRI